MYFFQVSVLFMISIFGLNFIDALHKYLSTLSKCSGSVNTRVSIAALCEFSVSAAPKMSYNCILKRKRKNTSIVMTYNIIIYYNTNILYQT